MYLTIHGLSFRLGFLSGNLWLDRKRDDTTAKDCFRHRCHPQPAGTHAIKPLYFFIYHCLKVERIPKSCSFRLPQFMLDIIQHLFFSFLHSIK